MAKTETVVIYREEYDALKEFEFMRRQLAKALKDKHNGNIMYAAELARIFDIQLPEEEGK